MSYVLCQKCLTGRSGDKAGDPCRTPGCDGIVQVPTPYRELVDVLPEPMTCGRRAEFGQDRPSGPFRFTGSGSNLDRWHRFKVNGDRVCSYCGSLHPEDFLRLIKECADAGVDAGDEAPSVDPSDKGYKIYVRRKGVRNAHEGGIKFYTQHLPQLTDPQQEIYRYAVHASRVRFDRALAAIRAGRGR